jgi:hypothetical protein
MRAPPWPLDSPSQSPQNAPRSCRNEVALSPSPKPGESQGYAAPRNSAPPFPQAFRTATLATTDPILGRAVKRRAVLFVLLAAAVVFVAWRVGAPSSGKAAEGEPSGSLSFEEEGSSTGATASAPAVMEMSVFTNPRTESDVLPSDYSFRLGSMSCNDSLRARDGCFGDDIAGESRLLLVGLGGTSASLYAWPMTSGGVCWAYDEGGGGCVNHFPVEDRAVVFGIDPDAARAGAPGTVIGLVPDDVVAGRVKVNGVDHDAHVQNNVLSYEPADAAVSCEAVDSVTISYRDGSSDTIPDEMIGWGWDPPEDDVQPAGHDVDALAGEPIAPPPGGKPPRC